MSVQVIEKNGQPEWAVIPYEQYQKLQAAYEDAEDIRDIEENLQALLDGRETPIPGEITFAVLKGTSPIRAWRKYRKITMKELAAEVGISAAYLSQIENGKRTPSMKTLQAIAGALAVDLEMLV